MVHLWPFGHVWFKLSLIEDRTVADPTFGCALASFVHRNIMCDFAPAPTHVIVYVLVLWSTDFIAHARLDSVPEVRVVFVLWGHHRR